MATPSSTNPRYFLISAVFDGTTLVDPNAWKSKKSANAPRLYQTVPGVAQALGPAGRFSFDSLIRPGSMGALVSVRSYRSPGPGDLIELRSVALSESKDVPPPAALDQLLESQPLARTWSKPFHGGPTDAIAVTHEPDGAATIELMVIDFRDGAALAWAQQLMAICCAEDELPPLMMEVTESTQLAISTGDLYVFVNMATAGQAITLAPRAGVADTTRVFFVRVGGEVFTVVPNGADTYNDQNPAAFEVAGFEEVMVEAIGAGWIGEGAVLQATVTTLANAAAGGTVQVPAPRGPSTTVHLNFTAHGFAQLAPLDEWPFDADLLLDRAGGTEQAVLIPETGELLNGEVDGRVYLGWNDAARLSRTANGLIAVVDGGRPDEIQTTAAVGPVLTPWGARRKILRLSGGAAQTPVLPARANVPAGAELVVAAVGAAASHTIDAAGADTITGDGAVAAANATLPQGVVAVIHAGDAGEWLITL